ncbi:MAG: polysaccharide pyruvyl transferase family protein [Tannerellaceae bacterium]|nr:polysaccharide pyruvyl transferase family protein [Tannerellaceae bacterium]
MNVGILTFQSANNYGAFLQAFALCSTMNHFEAVDAEIIDYICPAIENDYNPKKVLYRKGNKIKNTIAYILRKNGINKSALVFNQSRSKYFITRHSRVSRNELAELEKDFDLFIVGSDQVWNTVLTENDHTFFLDFVSNSQKKASYAASMGDVSFNDENSLPLKNELESFKYLSLRERESTDFVSSLLARDDVVTCIDPVFLISGREWEEYISTPRENNYLLYFCIGFPMQSTLSFAEELARKEHKKLLLLMDKDVPYKYVGITHLRGIGPMDFISYVYHADIIVTNSFHATAFSILFHKRFYVETVVKRRERIINLLKVSGLENRALVNGKVTQIQNQISWQDVDNNMKPWIEHSLNYLESLTMPR